MKQQIIWIRQITLVVQSCFENGGIPCIGRCCSLKWMVEVCMEDEVKKEDAFC